MLEGFKINCYPLNRTIRINIHLPNNYNDTGRYYPVVYFFDGQNVYNDLDSYSGKSLCLEQTIEKLKENGKEAIFITIAAAMNPEKRLQEYKETVLANFIINAVHPYLSNRYRFSNYIYSFGCSLAALNALAVNESDIFKGCVLLSPEADIDMVKELKLSNDKLYYIYTGHKELNGCCKILSNDIKKLLTSTNLVTDDNTIHDESAWKDKVYEALDYILL
jgi:predicted alpha/beta superfamily hydrolase